MRSWGLGALKASADSECVSPPWPPGLRRSYSADADSILWGKEEACWSQLTGNTFPSSSEPDIVHDATCWVPQMRPVSAAGPSVTHKSPCAQSQGQQQRSLELGVSLSTVLTTAKTQSSYSEGDNCILAWFVTCTLVGAEKGILGGRGGLLQGST